MLICCAGVWFDERGAHLSHVSQGRLGILTAVFETLDFWIEDDPNSWSSSASG